MSNTPNTLVNEARAGFERAAERYEAHRQRVLAQGRSEPRELTLSDGRTLRVLVTVYPCFQEPQQ